MFYKGENMEILLIISGIIILIQTYRIFKKERLLKSSKKMIRVQANELELLNKTMGKMAEDLTTDYHDKVWIIQHYLREVRNEKN